MQRTVSGWGNTLAGVSEVQSRAGFVPAYVGEIELGGPIERIVTPLREDGSHYTVARVVVRLHGTPLAIATLPLTAAGTVDPEEIVDGLNAQVANEIAEHLKGDGLRATTLTTDGLPAKGRQRCQGPAPASLATAQPLVTVLICTRDHPVELERAAKSVLACDHENLELVIIDNAPSDDASELVVTRLSEHDLRVRRVLEPTPGLSHARNRGLAEARGEVIAFTDDDVVVDRGWIDGLLQGFTLGEKVGLVTGVIPMGALENEHQQYFDDRVQWSENFTPRLYDLKDNRPDHPFFPYAAGMFGTGANFAIRADAARAVGDFDVALGAGAPTRGGEDLDYFVRMLFCDGNQIAYEPRALVWHYHRADADSLAQQMYGYGTGLTAYAFKTALQPAHFLRVVGLTAAFLWRRLVQRDRTYGVDTGHGELQRLQRKGLLAGPWLYIKARRSPAGAGS